MFKYWFILTYHSLRYLRAKRRGKTLRLKVDDFVTFSTGLNDVGIPILVLRWWDVIPRTKAEKKKYKNDIDCLIDENNIWPIIKLAAKHHGTTKVDLYGICGRNGTSYKGKPYYPPNLAKKIYLSRVWNNGYYIPSEKIYKYSFIYHVVYHKGTKSGINLDESYIMRSENKFLQELIMISQEDITLQKTNLTLFDLHNYLKKHEWSMPVDLMTRWDDNKEVIQQLYQIEKSTLSTTVSQLQGLNIFIIRDDAYIQDSISIIQSMISKRFNILIKYKLTNKQAELIMSHTRGGNWIEKRKTDPTKPTEIWICKPTIKNHSISKKLKKKYPLVDNFETLIKRDIREKINEIDHIQRVVIHSSDNDIESALILKTLFEDPINE